MACLFINDCFVTSIAFALAIGVQLEKIMRAFSASICIRTLQAMIESVLTFRAFGVKKILQVQKVAICASKTATLVTFHTALLSFTVEAFSLIEESSSHTFGAFVIGAMVTELAMLDVTFEA